MIVMYVITSPGGDRFICEDVQVCLANMGEGEGVYAVTFQEIDRELVARCKKGADVRKGPTTEEV